MFATVGKLHSLFVIETLNLFWQHHIFYVKR